MARIVQFNRLTQAAKLSLIETMVREFENPETIAPQLPANVMTELRQTAQQMRTIRNQRIEKTEARQRSTKAYQQSLTILRTRLRHAYQLVKRKAKQPGFPSSIVISFGLNSNGTYPKALQQLPEPLQIAKDMIQAEQNALEQGYSILTDPSEEELSQLVAEVEQNEAKRSLAMTEACQTKDREQQQIEACDKLIKRVRHYISFALTGQSPRRHQKVLEALGFTFTGKQNPDEASPKLNAEGDRLRLPKVTNVLTQDADPGTRQNLAEPPTTMQGPDSSGPTNASPPSNADTSTKQWQSNAGTRMSLQGHDSSCPTQESPPSNAETPAMQWPSTAGTTMSLQGLDSSSPSHESPPSNAEWLPRDVPIWHGGDSMSGQHTMVVTARQGGNIGSGRMDPAPAEACIFLRT